MSTEIKCPNCGHLFEPNDAIRDQVEQELRSKIADWQKKKNEEFQQKMDEEKKKLQESLEGNLRKSIAADYETQLKMAEQNNKDYEEKLQQARKQQLEFLEKLSVELRKLEEQRMSAKETEFQLQLKELQKQLDDQKKLAEEMRRKAEQGSMQTQGEVQELLLEELLKTAFPFDLVSEVGKGVRGADCIQTVRNNFGQECGRIIFESKRTKDFANDWIEKLKADMRSQGADVAVIVTQALPRDMDRFGEKDGVWICSFAEVKPVVQMIRYGIINVANAARSQENKGDKMHLLYKYLTSREFADQWSAIREGFMSMKLSIQKERDAMEKLWKAREKQLEKVMINATGIRGSIEGISGTEVDLNLLGDGTDDLVLD